MRGNRSVGRARRAFVVAAALALAGCAADRCCRPCPAPCAPALGAVAVPAPAMPSAPAAPAAVPPPSAAPAAAAAGANAPACAAFECFRFENHGKTSVEVVYALCDDDGGTQCTQYGRFVVGAGETCAHVPDPKRGARSMRVQVLDPTWTVSRPAACPATAPCLRRAHVHYYGTGLNAHAELVPHGSAPCAKHPLAVDPTATPFPAELQMPCSPGCPN